MNRWAPRIALLLVSATSALACTSHRRARLDLAPDERGVAELSDLLEQLKAAGRGKDFDTAYSVLSELEDGIARADTYTSSHPDFEDLERLTGLARRALDELAERDRRARRAAAIAALIERWNDQLAAGNALMARVVEEPPGEAELDGLDDINDAVEDLEDEGEEYRDDPQLATYLQQAQPIVDELRSRLAQVEWAVESAEDLDRPIRVALGRERRSRASKGIAQRIADLEVAVRELGRCAQIIERMRSADGYTTEIQLRTAFGALSIEEVGFNCRLRSGSVEHELARARWTQGVGTALAHMQESRRHLAVHGPARQRLPAVGSAIAALEQCRQLLVGTEQHAGFDSGAIFAAPVGRLSAVGVRATCRREAAGLAAVAADLAWEASLEQIGERAGEAQSHALAARRTRDVHDKIEFLGLAVGGFDECAERARHLAQARQRRATPKVASPFGPATVESIGRLCADRRHRIQKRLRKVMRVRKRRGVS